MPTLSNITVKKYDNTTDVVYTAVASAASDGVAAEYQNQTGFAIPSNRPTLKLSTRANGKGTSRRASASFVWPLTTVDLSGKTVRSGSVNGEFSMILPQDVDQTVVREAHQQFAKLLASSALKDVLDTGFAPR